MPYLEIYPMENSADKISKQLDLVLDAKPTMYAKTKDRYRQLAQSLLQSVSKISSILEEESLISHGHIQNEFNELSSDSAGLQNAELSQAAEEARNQISSYTQFTTLQPSTTPDSSHISNKEIISRFATVLSEASQHEFKCIEAQECAKLVYKWFKYRFIPEFKNPNFKYNIEYLPTWITYIIVLYGYYHSINQTSVLIGRFDKWCDEISQNFSNCFAVPYEVHSLMKEQAKPEFFTMDGVIVDDILMDEVYYQLTEPHFNNSKVLFDLYPVAMLAKTFNPSLLPQIRTRIAKRKELMDTYNFSLISEVG